MSSQLNRCRLVLERSVLIEQLIDPEREIEGSAIKIVLLEGFAGGSRTIDVGLFLFRRGLQRVVAAKPGIPTG